MPFWWYLYILNPSIHGCSSLPDYVPIIGVASDHYNDNDNDNENEDYGDDRDGVEFTPNDV